MADKNETSLFTVRVYLEDTDVGGVVFYANYLKYFERARTEFFRSRGFELRRGLVNNINYVVHSLNVQYKKSAYLDDKLIVKTSIRKVGRTYLIFTQTVFNQENVLLVDAEVKVACLHYDTAKPRRLPVSLISTI